MSLPKQKIYKTAYSKVFDCYVKITHAYIQNDGYGYGRWLFYVTNEKKEIYNNIHSENELKNFCL